MICERRNTSSSISRKPRSKRREVPWSDLCRFPNEACPWARDPAAGERGQLHEAVRAAVGSALTDKQRRAVEGYFFEGLSQGDLAERLGVTQQVVQKTLFGVVRRGKRVGGALSKLRAALAPLLAGPMGGSLQSREERRQS